MLGRRYAKPELGRQSTKKLFACNRVSLSNWWNRQENKNHTAAAVKVVFLRACMIGRQDVINLLAAGTDSQADRMISTPVHWTWMDILTYHWQCHVYEGAPLKLAYLPVFLDSHDECTVSYRLSLLGPHVLLSKDRVLRFNGWGDSFWTVYWLTSNALRRRCRVIHSSCMWSRICGQKSLEDVGVIDGGDAYSSESTEQLADAEPLKLFFKKGRRFVSWLSRRPPVEDWKKSRPIRPFRRESPAPFDIFDLSTYCFSEYWGTSRPAETSITVWDYTTR